MDIVPMVPGRISRRRAMTILGAFSGLPLLATDGRSPAPLPVFEWNGTSLGCPSRLLICHPRRSAAEEIATRCAAEIERLERIFALYRDDSEVARLNRDGRLLMPSHDLLVVLSQTQFLSALSDGAFDPTVQPLWELYAAHFFTVPSPAPEGPAPRAIAAALRRVDWKGIDISARQIVLARPDMRLTLNGIAQGYVTDRITDILRNHGFDRVLADLGRSEIGAIGMRPDGRPWQVGLADPRQPEQFALTLDLTGGSVCTSGGYGTKFEASGKFHHLLDPATGTSANHSIAVSVLAPNTMLADGLSTTLYVTPPDRASQLLAHFPGVTALVTQPDGKIHQLVGGVI